jgi:hypothetical protein
MAKTQYQIVIEELEKLGGKATLGMLIQQTLLNPEFSYKGKTPQANIRRIVQTTSELYKIKPGLYSLESMRLKNEANGLIVETEKNKQSSEYIEFTHGYYQGLLIEIGNIRKYKTFSPNQDDNRLFIDKPLKELKTLDSVPQFSYDTFVKRSKTIDVIWFQETKSSLMPFSFFEVEHSTDIQNSIIKFNDLRDFSARKFIVADIVRKKEFYNKMDCTSFKSIDLKIEFYSYEDLAKTYEQPLLSQQIMTKI